MGLNEKLYSWQKDIVAKVAEKQSYGLFLDCGLGKTLISLSLAELHDCENILVITINPKALETDREKGSWFWWANQMDKPPKQCTKKSKTVDGDRNILLINYESLYKRNGSSAGIELNDIVGRFIDNSKGKRVCLIIDESHKMKNLQTNQTKCIYRIQKTLKLTCESIYTYLCTGTPFTQGFIDLYSQLKFLGCTLTKQEFVDRFCVVGNIYGLLGWQQPIVGYKNTEELYELVHQFAVTVRSTDVVQLPEQVFVELPQPNTKAFDLFVKDNLPKKETLKLNEQRRKDGYQHFETEEELKPYTDFRLNPWARNLSAPQLDYLADTPSVAWMRARQASIGFQGNGTQYTVYDDSRFKAVGKFLEEHPGNYVLFYNYTPEFIELFYLCSRLGYDIDAYTGSIKELTYYEEYESMTPEQRLVSSKRILLANFASGSTGLNLQAYNKAIIFSLPVYKDYEQALKRIHRIGQKQTAIYYIFTSDNWLEKSMKASLDECTDYTAEMFANELKLHN